MFLPRAHTRIWKLFVSALTTLAVFAASTEAGHAYGIDASNELQHGTAVYGGNAAMLGLRVTFGGDSKTAPQPMVGLSFGSAWREAPNALVSGGYRFVPAAELGMTFGGEPILRVGSLDAAPTTSDAEVSRAQGESTFCGRNLGLCIGGAVVIVAVVWIAVGAVYER